MLIALWDGNGPLEILLLIKPLTFASSTFWVIIFSTKSHEAYTESPSKNSLVAPSKRTGKIL